MHEGNGAGRNDMAERAARREFGTGASAIRVVLLGWDRDGHADAADGAAACGRLGSVALAARRPSWPPARAAVRGWDRGEPAGGGG